MGLCCSRATSDKCKSQCSPVSLIPVPITKATCVVAVRDRVEVSLVGNIVPTSRALHPDNYVAMSKLSTIVKGKVSKKRIRYQENGYDLDLTYITPNIIAMGYPASNIEAVYRNNIEDVARFLDSVHKDHYKIYNLCSERAYDTSKFHNRVEVFPFDDHNPPKLELIEPFCNSVQTWLREDGTNVAVVHCKAGKGRTGTMICCYLLHSGKFSNSDDALNHYGGKRTQDMKGVTIPSQLRYVNYYARLVRDSMKYRPVQVYIKEVILEPSPCFSGGNMGTLCFSISQPITTEGQNGQPYQKLKKVLKSEEHDVKKSVPKFSVQLDSCSPLVGDVKVEFYYKMLRKEKLFQFWFNTFFVCEKVHVYDSNGCVNKNGSSTTTDELVQQQTFKFTLSKKELDIVNKKDKQNKTFSSDFHITLLLSRVPMRNSAPTTNASAPPLPPLHTSPVHHPSYPSHSHHPSIYPHTIHHQHGLNGSAINQQQQQQQQQQEQPIQWREFLRKQRMNNNRDRPLPVTYGLAAGHSVNMHMAKHDRGGLMTSASQGMIPQQGGFNPANTTSSSSSYHNKPASSNHPHQQQQQPHTSTLPGCLPPLVPIQSSTSSTAIMQQQQQQQHQQGSGGTTTNIAICSDSSTSSSDDDSSDGCCGGPANDDEYNWDSGESQSALTCDGATAVSSLPYDHMMNIEAEEEGEREERSCLLPPANSGVNANFSDKATN